MYEELRNELKKRKYRITAQREMILKIFLESRGRHLGVEEVYRELLNRNVRISKATVYRSVELLVELGFLRKLNFGEGLYRYELAERSDRESHQHVICQKCGRIVEINSEQVNKIISDISKKTGYAIKWHDLKFYGICPECREKEKEEEKRSK
ncbi:ferric uptake regulator, Fur family [Thermotoga petrophila RKU-1]|uniref:Ferric uptake regulator, Fur family n=1 Tax=Thermotoga petrophila (strain ATCC BAA-488 / DSM 13995 / JCM 10881 / RKU-1) TaxID=390874 RepID=A5ILK8_THEP1|nr:Fur family transcriptional regulator [Thermotoga petrophila]ABQ47081.1 ferric uptake regulator, Fur family [Thermotoga petrophila RKU-1]